MKNNTQTQTQTPNITNVLKMTSTEFGLVKSMLEQQLKREQSPKHRSMDLELYRKVTGYEHPSAQAFEVYGFYSEAQAAIHGTKIWVDGSGQLHEVSHVAYQNEPAPEFAGDSSRIGKLHRFYDNGQKSMAVQAREAQKALIKSNSQNLGSMAMAFRK